MSEIEFTIGIGLKAPIAVGIYEVDVFRIEVLYPRAIDLGMGPMPLPSGLSTVFKVKWEDAENIDCTMLKSQTFNRHLVIYKALSAISEFLQAFKLVRIGHIDGLGIRTIGISDTLFYFSTIDGEDVGDLNCRFMVRHPDSINPTPHDLFGTTAIALPHIAKPTMPVARRYLRCYELLEHGFYSEGFIIAFSIFDDLVQEMLHYQLEAKGMGKKPDRDLLLRGIKENRLKLYLGPLLKITSGKTIVELWPHAEKAIGWLNKIRNNIAHGGFVADHNITAVGIYACIKLLYELDRVQLLVAEFPVEFFRHSKLTASWTANPPEWVPSGLHAESMDYNS